MNMIKNFRFCSRTAFALIQIFMFGILFFIIFSSKDSSSGNFHLKDVKLNKVGRCYAEPAGGSIKYFDDIMDHAIQPKTGKSIFFLETTCSKTGLAKLTSRQACAIESTALHNPDREIFVIFASPVGVNKESESTFLDTLTKFPNVHFRTVNLWRYSFDTPIFEWLKTNVLFKSKYVFEHMSDIFRIITLYKYGGFYLDLDVVVQKSFDNMDENFVSDDWDKVVNGAVMHMNNDGIGLEVIQRYLRKILDNYDPKEFLSAGPMRLTEVLTDLCETSDRKLWTPEQCSGFMVQPKEMFFPIGWAKYKKYFDPAYLEEVLEASENSILIHVWNDRSKKLWNEVGVKNAYQMIAKKNCPNIYSKSVKF